MKKTSRIRNRTRQRQKMSRRTVILIAASCFVMMGVGLTVFFNLTQVDQTRAKEGHTYNVIMVPDVKLVNEKVISAPFLDPRLSNDPNAIYIRQVKVLPVDAKSVQE